MAGFVPKDRHQPLKETIKTPTAQHRSRFMTAEQQGQRIKELEEKIAAFNADPNHSERVEQQEDKIKELEDRIAAFDARRSGVVGNDFGDGGGGYG